MNKYIIVIALFATALPCISQDLPDYSENINEINLGYFNAFELNGINELGIGYKRLINNGALRTAAGFNFHTQANETDDSQSKHSYYAISPRVGYEFYQSFNRLRLHYGADVATSFSSNNFERTYDSPDIPDYTNNSREFQLGFRPILGLTMFINKSISITTETYLDFSYYKSTDERSDSDYSNTTTGLRMGLGPLGIVSVNFHF